MEINLNDYIIEDLKIKLDGKEVVVKRQEIFDQSVRYVSTYGEENLTGEKIVEIWKENTEGDTSLIDRIPPNIFNEYNGKLIDEGLEKFEKINFTDSNSQKETLQNSNSEFEDITE